MHDTINIVGDIAGHYDELMELLGKMPAASLTLAVGDLVDRGPKSREVIEWFMGDPLSRESVLGNHEAMMIYACRNQPMDPLNTLWGWNGGSNTWTSYEHKLPPEEHLRWLEKRPLWYCQPGLFVSHAPLHTVDELPVPYVIPHEINDLHNDEDGFIWNRYLSKRPMKNHFMVYGHNSHYVEHEYVTDEGLISHYATCIDNSRHRQLMGLHWPTKELFSVEYH